jgi:hypothetical protein
MEAVVSFQVSSLPLDQFDPFFTLTDAELPARGAKRYIADRAPGFPCRVSLEDAAPGETVVLVSYQHQPADSPYRAAGPVFVRESARQAAPAANEIPALLRLRTLSLRAYDADGFMVEADVVDGREMEAVIERLLNNPRTQYLHVHFAKPGCYACRIDRA